MLTTEEKANRLNKKKKTTTKNKKYKTKIIGHVLVFRVKMIERVRSVYYTE